MQSQTLNPDINQMSSFNFIVLVYCGCTNYESPTLNRIGSMNNESTAREKQLQQIN